jgi:hypothetical protein
MDRQLDLLTDLAENADEARRVLGAAGARKARLLAQLQAAADQVPTGAPPLTYPQVRQMAGHPVPECPS